MARRRFLERLGSALEGGAAAFSDAWTRQEDLRMRQQELERRKLSDRQGFMRDVGGQIRTGWQTADKLEPHILSAMQDYGMSREEATTSLSQYLPTEEQRVREIYRQLGPDATKWVPSAARRIGASVGMPDFGMSRRTLETMPMPGVGGGYAPVERPPTGLLDFPDERDSLDPDWTSGPPVTGKLMAPLSLTERSLRPFSPGATGGAPLEWGGPRVDQMAMEQEEAFDLQRKLEGMQLSFEARQQRQELGITQEKVAEFFDQNTEMNLLAMRKLGKEDANQEIDKRRRVLEVERDEEILRMDPAGEYAKRFFAKQRELAVLSAVINDRPEWLHRRDADGTPRLWAITRDWVTGALQFSDATESVDSTSPWYPEYRGPDYSELISSAISEVSGAGMDADPLSPEGQKNIMQAVERRGGDPQDAFAFFNAAKGWFGDPTSGVKRPPVTSEETENNIERFLGGGDPREDPRGDPQESRFLPLADFEEVLSQDRRVFGSRPSGPGQRQATINLGNILEGPGRDLDNFLRTEGVQDWITAHTGGTSDVTEEMVKDMLNTREGLKLLKKAFLERNDPIHDYPQGRETDLISR